MPLSTPVNFASRLVPSRLDLGDLIDIRSGNQRVPQDAIDKLAPGDWIPRKDIAYKLGLTGRAWDEIIVRQITFDGGGSTIRVEPQVLIDVGFTAGEDISDGDLVYISAANTVKKGLFSQIDLMVGVANETKTNTNQIDIVVFGRKAGVIAQTTVTQGDYVYTGTTAGRAIGVTAAHIHSESTHTHTETGSETGTPNSLSISSPVTMFIGRALTTATAGNPFDLLVGRMT